MAKPFVKWAGGKGRLIKPLKSKLPADFENHDVTYIEPFVGGGAMLFHMLKNYPRIKRAIINDINPELILCYKSIKECPDQLIEQLKSLEADYYSFKTTEQRKKFYYTIRDSYNLDHTSPSEGDVFAINRAAHFIFLNRTCFNGLYRENSKGEFNVPFGRYANPVICNEEVIRDVSGILQKTIILGGDYHKVMDLIVPEETNFIYLDPPYRPLEGSSNFKDYTKFEFGDKQQEELKQFCDELNNRGVKFMLSNSYCLDYFKELYNGYVFDRLWAPRAINAFAAKRNPVYELLIRNYKNINEPCSEI